MNPEVCLSFHWDYKRVTSDFWGWNSGPCALKTSASPTEPFLQPPQLFWLNSLGYRQSPIIMCILEPLYWRGDSLLSQLKQFQPNRGLFSTHTGAISSSVNQTQPVCYAHCWKDEFCKSLWRGHMQRQREQFLSPLLQGWGFGIFMVWDMGRSHWRLGLMDDLHMWYHTWSAVTIVTHTPDFSSEIDAFLQ